MTILMGIRRPDFNWEGMMNWWSAHSDGSHTPPVSEEENLQHMEDSNDDYDDDYDVGDFDVVQRVHTIGTLLIDGPEELKRMQIVGPLYSEAEIIDLLVELQDLAEYVDIAEELHSGTYLAPFFHNLLCYKYEAGTYNKHAAVRTKAAEVVTTMVQNNPTNVVKVNGLQPLLDNFMSDPDVTARNKALVAILSLIWNYKFKKLRESYKLNKLRDALNSDSARLQCESLIQIEQLLPYEGCNEVVAQLGLPRIMIHLTSSDNAQVREAALRGLLVLARDECGQLVRNDDKLKQVLQERIEGISAMSPEDLTAAREEILLVDLLWSVYYNEPSSLEEKGLLARPWFH